MSHRDDSAKKEYNYPPIQPCLYCRKHSVYPHECRTIDLYDRIDSLEQSMEFMRNIPFPFRDPDGADCYADMIRFMATGMLEGHDA